MKEMVGGCCVCADENGWTDNPLIYCDGDSCEVAVHQGCYGIQEVPEGEWFCAKCTDATSAPPGSTDETTYICQLCPYSHGALKKTDRAGWAHVICALYIPEVRFGNVHSMEPVILSDVPCDKFNRTCYICNDERPEDSKKGACMSCNKSTCKRSFHVTCAQRKGLLCEEGAISRNVKYCGYCEGHLKKAINDPAIKVIPACPPVQRVPREEKKKAKVLSAPPPPPKPPSMLVDLPRPDQVNSVLGLGSSNNSIVSTTSDERPTTSSLPSSGIFAPLPTAFSPPLTTSSRSSVALEPTPPLTFKNSITSSGPLIPSTASSSATTSSIHSTMANGNSFAAADTTVGNHCLQSLHQSGPPGPSNPSISLATPTSHTNISMAVLNDLSGYPGPSQLSSFMHEIPARNTTSVASLLPPGAAEYHLNGSGDEEKTVKAVLTAPLAKAKRMRDSKNDLVDKTNKRPRANTRPPALLGTSTSSTGGTVGKSASMQRLISLVAPVVSETVTDFQRDRVADRTAAERRAAAAQSLPSTSTNGTLNPTNPEVHANTNSTSHPNNVIPAAVINSLPGPSSSDAPTQNGTSVASVPPRIHIPSFMEQLLERQWDQGSNLLISNAHFDVAQLFSCLFQLKSENYRLEENLANLRKRRDHLYTLNMRLNEVNVHDVPKRQRDQVQLLQSDTTVVPKLEQPKAELLTPNAVHLPASHAASHAVNHIAAVSALLEESKISKAAHRKAIPITTAVPTPVTLSSAPSLLTTTAATSGVLANAQNNRATPSTAGAPMAAAPVMTAVTAANEMAMSPERIANLQNINLAYRNMPIMQDPNNLAAQLTMLASFPNQLNPLNAQLFSRLLTQPQQLAAAVSMINNHLPSGTPTPLPPTSATPNGK